MLKLSLRASRRLMLVLLLAHALSLVAIFTIPLPGWLTAVATVAVIFSAVRYLRAVRAPVVESLELKAEHRCLVRHRHESGWTEARALPGSFAGALLTVMKLALDDQRRPSFVTIFPDQVSADDYRRLQVWLRWPSAAPLRS